MPKPNSEKVSITLLNREFDVACAPDEKGALLQATRTLNTRLRDLRGQGSTQSNFEQLLVVAALNLCHDVNNGNTTNLPTTGDATSALQAAAIITRLINKVDLALDEMPLIKK